MSYQSKIMVNEELSYLQERLHKCKNNKVKLKLKCLILLKKSPKKKQEDLAIHLSVGYSTIRRWLAAYHNNGLEDFLQINRNGGRKNIITKEIHNALEVKLQDSTNSLLGYWDAVRWIKAEFNIDMKYNTLRMYLKKHFKTKLKSPRKSHYKKDEQAIEAFFKTA